MIVIDKLCYESKLRYINACEKFAFAILTLLICVISRSIAIAAIVLFVNGILTVKKGGISFSRYIRLMKIPGVFLILSTLAIVVNFSHTKLDAFAVLLPFGSWYMTGSWSGIRFAVQLILTALAAVSCLYFLSLSTPMPDILEVLRKMHCPLLIIELMLLIYRFIFVLLQTAHSITTAQNSRLGNINFRTQCQSFGSMGSALLIRSFKRSNALYDAMESRCYDGTIKVLSENNPPAAAEIIYIAVFEILLAACAAGVHFLL